jgi:tRNA 2-thiocytidine biosynthesis protein TtcA
MLQDWDTQFPGRIESMFTATQNISLSHLADTKEYDFINLQTQDHPFEDGDTAFDPIELPAAKTTLGVRLDVNSQV